MTLRADTASVLIEMGYVADIDFIASEDATGLRITWLAGSAMPSAAAINAFDLSAAQIASLYTKAKALLTADDPISTKEKAVLLVILDALNRQSRQFRDLLAVIAAATSLANLQTRVAAISPVEPARSAQDLKTAVANKIDAGEANG